MKRFVLNIFAFTGMALLIYIVLLILAGTFAPVSWKKNLLYSVRYEGYSNTYFRLQEAEKTKDIDLLVLGSSHAYRGYDPRIFFLEDCKVFNLGTSGQTPIETESLFNKYLSGLNPRTVILDIYPPLFENDGTECLVDLVQNAPIDRNTLNLSLKINNMKVYNTMAYSMYREMFHLNRHLNPRPPDDSDKYISGGYIETYRKYSAPVSYSNKKVSMATDQLSALDRILQTLKNKNIPFVLVQAPITQRAYSFYRDNDKIDSIFRQRGPYYNFNTIMHLPDSLFYNDDHLNQNGVNAFNEKLIDTLKHTGFLKGKGQ